MRVALATGTAVGLFAATMSSAGARPGISSGVIAFQNFNRISYDIYAVRPDGGGLRDLTRTAMVDEFEPTWSPDGKRIAFAAASAGDSTTQIFVMNRDGSGRHQLISSGIWQRSPAWSPDGRWIAFSRCELLAEGDCSSAQITVVGADGNGLRVVTKRASHWQVDGKPSWSPDGKHIVFTRTPSFGVNSVWVVGSDARGVRKIVDDDSPADHNPSWSRGGNLIAYATDAPGPEAIFIARADGSHRRKVIVDQIFDIGSQGGEITNPAFAAVGSRIAFTFHGEVWTMNTSGGSRRRVTRDGGDEADWTAS